MLLFQYDNKRKQMFTTVSLGSKDENNFFIAVGPLLRTLFYLQVMRFLDMNMLYTYIFMYGLVDIRLSVNSDRTFSHRSYFLWFILNIMWGFSCYYYFAYYYYLMNLTRCGVGDIWTFELLAKSVMVYAYISWPMLMLVIFHVVLSWYF